jgi:glycosyltransferase involved in cell wall biosynthesis
MGERNAEVCDEVKIMGRFRVSIIICTRNRAESLRETLSSIARCEVPADLPTELLVVDNGSSDQTAEVVHGASLPRLPSRYLREPVAGLSHARNLGTEYAAGEICLFTDDDVEVPQDWIERMCRPIAEGRADAVAGEIEPHPSLERPWLKGFVRTLVTCTEHEPRIDMVGANMAFRRSVLERVPAFDVELGVGGVGLGEDTLFSYQIESAGLKIHRATDAKVVHHFDPSRLEPPAFLRIAAKSGCSTAYLDFHWRHQDAPRARYKLLSYSARYFVRRMLTPGRWRNGVPAWEVAYVQKVNYYRQYLVYRGTPRKYEKRGLVKLKEVRAPHAATSAPNAQTDAIAMASAEGTLESEGSAR